MMLFDFFKKFFGWADESSRKRSADDSSSTNEEFIQAKRHCGDDKMGPRLPVFIDSRYSLEDDDDDVQISTESVCRAGYSKKLLNGARNEKGKGFCCLKPTTVMNPLSKCTPRPKRDDSSIDRFAENSNPNTSNLFTDSKYSTITKTHRLREKKQYREMLQNFVPHRIQILNSRVSEVRPAKQSPEVIDLEKYVPRQSQTFLSRPQFFSTNSQWFARNKLKERITTLETKFSDQTDRTSRKSTSVNKTVKDAASAAASTASTSASSSSKTSGNESIVSNSLRDRLASKAVMKNDFIPQISKQYNAKIEERNKEAEELKRLTGLLSKQNRLAREAALEEQLARSMRLCEAVLDDREEPEEAPLPVLTPAMLQEVRNALVPHPPNQVLVEGFGLQITRKDIHTLSGLNWLNDEVINFYMNLLIVRGTTGNFPKVHVMNTFFYPKLLTGGHSSLKRWTRKVDIFSKDLLVVPIHLGMHWCMSVVDFREKTIRYFDSMGGSNPKCLNALKRYLQDESLDKKKQPYDVTDWSLENVKDIPQQMNGSDCGVFSCMFAEYICGNKKLTFSQKDMPYFRNKMVYEILKSKLL